MFFNKPGRQKVERGQYTVMSAKTNKIILPSSWDILVAPGDQSCMSMMIQSVGQRKRCPHCKLLIRKSSETERFGITWYNSKVPFDACKLTLVQQQLRTLVIHRRAKSLSPDTIGVFLG